MIESGFTTVKPHNFKILMDISCPWALEMLSDPLILIMSLFSNLIEAYYLL